MDWIPRVESVVYGRSTNAVAETAKELQDATINYQQACCGVFFGQQLKAHDITQEGDEVVV